MERDGFVLIKFKLIMEKIINTTKYMKALKIVLIAVAFAISSPLTTLASTWEIGPDSGSTWETGTTDSGSTWEIGPDSGSTWEIGTNSGSTWETGTTNTNPILLRTVSSGGSSIGNTTQVQSVSYPVIIRQVTSGGYSGGYSTYEDPTVYYVPTATVTSGSFSGGTNYYTAPTTYYVPSATVQSGSFNGASPTYVAAPTPTVSNQVLAYNDTPLNAVYLSGIPATGFEDTLPAIIFISSLILWSAILAFLFLKRKIDSQTVFATAFINKSEINNKEVSNFANQIASDNSDISKVEEYARSNKVLLSSDAGVKLVKLSRLGKINVSEYIQSIATGEWVAIGENQISL